MFENLFYGQLGERAASEPTRAEWGSRGPAACRGMMVFRGLLTLTWLEIKIFVARTARRDRHGGFPV